LYNELIELVREDAEALGCTAEIGHVHRILGRGTSAHRQLALRQQLLADGLTEAAANRQLIAHLIDETANGVRPVGVTTPAGGR
jgi:carboxylate-amine ligase